MTFKCWNCSKEHPVSIKKDWGFNQVCTPCEDSLFMQDVMNSKYADRDIEYEEEPEYEEV
jgi:hypothetical protein